MAADDTLAKPAKPRRPWNWRLEIGIALAIMFLLVDETRLLMIGWIYFLADTVPEVHLNWLLIGEAAACIVVVAIGGHYFCRWLWAQMAHEGRPPWRPQWTAVGLASVLLLFVAGLASVGVTEHIAYLRNPDVPLRVSDFTRWWMPKIMESVQPARTAVDEHFARTGRLPQNAKEAAVDTAKLVTNEHVKAIDIEPDGVVVVSLQQHVALGGVLVLTPVVDGGQLLWTCASNIDRRWLVDICAKRRANAPARPNPPGEPAPRP